MPSISINGKTITVNGPGSITITSVNGSLIINGQDVTPGDDKQITIAITGDVSSLDVQTCQSVTVTGSVGNLRSGSGDVHVEKTVQAITTSSGDVTCGDVGGSVSTSSGDVTCRKVAGNVRTSSGDVSTRR